MMMKGKKGISPLIATILLIGFTVVLAAFIMTWGMDYVKGIAERGEEQSAKALTCSSDLDFEIVSANCTPAFVQIDNRGAIDIAYLKFKIVQASGDSLEEQTTDGVPSLAIRTFPLTSSMGGVQRVEAFAAIVAEAGKPAAVCENVEKAYQLNCP